MRRFAVIGPWALCQEVEGNISAACRIDGMWHDGITTDYGCVKHPQDDKGYLEVLEGYEEYFKEFEYCLEYVDELSEDWFENDVKL